VNKYESVANNPWNLKWSFKFHEKRKEYSNMFIDRALISIVKEASKTFLVLLVTGPRQVGQYRFG